MALAHNIQSCWCKTSCYLKKAIMSTLRLSYINLWDQRSVRYTTAVAQDSHLVAGHGVGNMNCHEKRNLFTVVVKMETFYNPIHFRPQRCVHF